MATITQTGQRATRAAGYDQTPEEATDLDGYTEMAVQCRADNYVSGGTTFYVELLDALRNRETDYQVLATFEFAASGSSRAYLTDFARFVRSRGYFATGNGTSYVEPEVLLVPKK
jgi:hypothetical protein